MGTFDHPKQNFLIFDKKTTICTTDRLHQRTSSIFKVVISQEGSGQFGFTI